MQNYNLLLVCLVAWIVLMFQLEYVELRQKHCIHLKKTWICKWRQQTVTTSYNKLQQIKTKCNQLQPTVTNYNQLQPTKTHYNQLQQLQPITTNDNQLYPITTNYNQLQPITTKCTQLQPIATNYNQLNMQCCWWIELRTTGVTHLMKELIILSGFTTEYDDKNGEN